MAHKRNAQISKVINQLKERNYVTRNWALRNYISRISAIILDLKNKNEGFEFESFYHKNKKGNKDYVYKLIQFPKRQIQTPIYSEDGRKIIRFEKTEISKY